MAGRFNNPFPQFMDSTPTMLSGAKLFFYAAGTSTKLSTYTDAGLSSANTNPVVLNSAGRPPSDIFLQDLDYKVVLAPSTDSDPPVSPIWTADNFNARDSKLIAKTLTGSGSPNGAVAGTAGSASILPDFYWDYLNSLLYVCTTTGTTLTAVWTAINATNSTTATIPPQGRLTLTSGTPVLSTDVTAASSIYYTPYRGNQVPIYNGSGFISTVFSELTLSLVSQHAASTMYDVFIFSNSGVLTLVTGPAWSNSASGSGARSTGAGTTQLTLLSGLLVNAVQITGRNGTTTYTIPANTATYLGSIFINTAAGQVSCTPAVGQTRTWGVWNYYNRERIILQTVEPTASWTNNAAGTISASLNNVLNSAIVMTGMAEENYEVVFSQNLTQATAFPSASIGIGWNSTTVYSGQRGSNSLGVAGQSTSVARYMQVPALGKHVVTPCESSATAVLTFLGTASNFLCSVNWRG